MARVAPLFCFAIVVQAALLAAHGQPLGVVLSTGLAHLALLQPWWPEFAGLGNVPGWSIGVEAFYYLSFPLLVGALMRALRATVALVFVASWLGGMAVALAVHASGDPWLTSWVRFLPPARWHES